MFDFANPTYLYLLAAVPVAVLLFMAARASRRAKLRRFGRMASIEHLMPDTSRYTPAVKLTLQMIALAALVIVLARPRAGAKEQQEVSAGIEVMIAFDVSNPMLASSTDRPDGVSRLDRARLLLEKLVDRLDNDKVGLIVFAGEAYTQLPITTDFLSARMYLDEISTEMVATQGTAIGTAINMSINSFSTDDEVNKAIIVITDGENHEGDALEMAKYAESLGIEVDVIGVGSLKGAPIPLNGNRGEFLHDASGAPVTTYLNENMAKEIAQAGGGEYINGSGNKAVDQLVDRLDKIKKSDLKHISYKASAEQFPVFVWIALLLLAIDVCVFPGKIGWLKQFTFFSKEQK